MNEIIKPPVADLQAFANFYISKGLEPAQISYLTLYERKKELCEDLEKKELEAQSKLLTPGSTILEIEKTLIEYRGLYKSMSELRLPFTNFIKSNLIDTLMEYEKRVDPENNDTYSELNKDLINKKDEASKIAKANAAFYAEKAKYLAHIKNENIQRVSEFKQKCLHEINTMYSQWLAGKIENPEINVLQDAIRSIMIRDPVRMERLYVNDTQAAELYQTWLVSGEVFQVNQEEETALALSYVDTKFSTYKNDLELLKAKPEIITEITNAGKLEESKIQEDANTQQSVNTLVSSSTSATSFKTEYKALKEAWIVEPENTRTWAIEIMSTFLKTPELEQYVKVKEWGNLKISQMADAIGKHAQITKFPNLKYKMVKS